MMKDSAVLSTYWTPVAKYKKYLGEAGFENVVEKRYAWPLGTWAKDMRMKRLGELYREDLKEEIRSNKIHIYVLV
jgi:hypothetical protein